MTGKLWVALIAAFVVPWLLIVLSAGRVAGRQQGAHRVVEYSPLYSFAMSLSGLFFAALAVLAWRFPGKTSPAVLPAVIAVFLGFAGLSLLGLLLARRSVVLWNDRELAGADRLGRRHRFDWSELARVEYVEASAALRLTSQDGRRVWLSPLMRGFWEFHQELSRQADTRGLALPEIRDFSPP